MGRKSFTGMLAGALASFCLLGAAHAQQAETQVSGGDASVPANQAALVGAALGHRFGIAANDASLATDVTEKLRQENLADSVRVTVSGEVVTLKGKVSSERERQKAVAAASSMRYPNGVIDRLTISERSDGSEDGSSDVPSATLPGITPSR